MCLGSGDSWPAQGDSDSIGLKYATFLLRFFLELCMFFLIFYDPEQVERSRSEKWKNEQIIRRATIRAPLAERVDTQKPKKKSRKTEKIEKKGREKDQLSILWVPLSPTPFLGCCTHIFYAFLCAQLCCHFICLDYFDMHLSIWFGLRQANEFYDRAWWIHIDIIPFHPLRATHCLIF